MSVDSKAESRDEVGGQRKAGREANPDEATAALAIGLVEYLYCTGPEELHQVLQGLALIWMSVPPGQGQS